MPVIVFFLLLGSASLAGAALPADELWREAILNQYVGVGTVTGGAGGTLCTVTNLLNSGAGSLRSCVDAGTNRWIIFQAGLTGVINLLVSPGNNLLPQSNVTIDGRGADITISGTPTPLIHIAATNIIITNLKFDNGAGDAINTRPSFDRIWFDHLFMGQTWGDEAIDSGCSPIGTGTRSITFSWIHWSPIPAGEGPFLITTSADVTITDCSRNDVITVHHNYFDQLGRRAPFMEYAKVHAFNNYHKNTVACINPPCMSVDVRSDGQYYSENEIFECVNPHCNCIACVQAVSDKWPRISTRNWTPPTQNQFAPANMKVIGQWSVTGVETYDADLNPGTIFTPSSFYSYTAVTADATLRDAIVAGAGWQNVTVPPGTPSAPTNLRVVSP